MKQVPEGTVVVEHEEQLRRLNEDLLGHGEFRRRRGHMTELLPYIGTLLNAADSPSDLLRRFDEEIGDARVMANLLAKYRRDGLNIAEAELIDALRHSDHFLPGEEAPMQDLVPVTFLMFEPHKTMLMLEWIMRGQCDELNNYLDGVPVTPLAQELFLNFPTLEEATRLRRHRQEYEGWDLLVAHVIDVIQKFPSLSKIDTIHIGREFNIHKHFTVRYGYQYFDDQLEIRRNERRKFRGEEINYGRTFLYMFAGDQGVVLSQFTRDEQKLIASWQMHVPKSVVQQQNITVGIHPDNEHAAIRQHSPVYSSRGVSNGLGIIILNPRRMEAEYFKGRGRRSKTPFRAVLD